MLRYRPSRYGGIYMIELDDIDVMFMPGETGERMEVIVFDGDEPIISESLIDLVAEWNDTEAITGNLHPYMDSTLNIVSDLSYAIIKTLQRVEPGDPHVSALLELYIKGYEYVQDLVHAINADTSDP